jgi:hypothetical protein
VLICRFAPLALCRTERRAGVRALGLGLPHVGFWPYPGVFSVSILAVTQLSIGIKIFKAVERLNTFPGIPGLLTKVSSLICRPIQRVKDLRFFRSPFPVLKSNYGQGNLGFPSPKHHLTLAFPRFRLPPILHFSLTSFLLMLWFTGDDGPHLQ